MTEPTIKLMPFTATHENRLGLQMPFRCRGLICASNGHIIVGADPDHVADIDPRLEISEWEHDLGVAQYLEPPAGDGLPAPDLPSESTWRIHCTICQGTGQVIDCPDCVDGDRDCPTCGTLGACNTCDGSGRIPGNLFPAESNTCLRCMGTGHMTLAVGMDVGTSHIQVRYVAELAKLPGCRLFPPEEAPDELPLRFRFDHGCGAVMPFRRT